VSQDPVALLQRNKKLVDEHERQIRRLEATIDDLRSRTRWYENSRSWKLTAPLRVATRIGKALTVERSRIASIVSQFPNRLRTEGLGATGWLREQLADLDHSPQHVSALEGILSKHSGKPIIVTHPGVDWAIPLFQRPQQLARCFARDGFLVFFATENRRYDDVDGFREIEPGLFLTNQNALLLSRNRRRIIYVCSTSFTATPETIAAAKARSDVILYDYIDEIHEDLSGPMPASLQTRHDLLLRDTTSVCVASADRLIQHVNSARGATNCDLVCNGVDAAHFRRRNFEQAHPLLQPILAKGRPIVGYYGALANWFDYDLVADLAAAMPDLEFVLIGPNYDSSAHNTRIHRLANVSSLGPIPYSELPWAAESFSVATIPFKLNDVTSSTSPIKLFEYMALGLPIVTTDLLECRKYRSVLIGRNVAEFAECIRRAIGLKNDSRYQALLAEEAGGNTWDARARQIETLIAKAWQIEPSAFGQRGKKKKEEEGTNEPPEPGEALESLLSG